VQDGLRRESFFYTARVDRVNGDGFGSRLLWAGGIKRTPCARPAPRHTRIERSSRATAHPRDGAHVNPQAARPNPGFCALVGTESATTINRGQFRSPLSPIPSNRGRVGIMATAKVTPLAADLGAWRTWWVARARVRWGQGAGEWGRGVPSLTVVLPRTSVRHEVCFTFPLIQVP
jgi:hypothetical protein